MKVTYIGNFGPEHSTESHVAQALRSLGHDLTTVQENEVENWRNLAAGIDIVGQDLVMWTRTGWDWRAYGISAPDAHALQRTMLARARSEGVPTVGYHLDRWWGLRRQHEVVSEPFFRVDLLITADGGHDPEWAGAGVSHLWMPPGVSEFECVPGTYTPDMASPIAFVGSWLPGYHAEYPQRGHLVRYLQDHESDRCRLWPLKGAPAVRGDPLRDLYASVKILIGDSCLNGGIHHYWSDRIPETLGRGGFLIHPDVVGLEEHFTSDEHLVTYPLGDYRRLGELIRHFLQPELDEVRQKIAAAGREHVLRHHTYTVRMRQVEAALRERGLLA